MPSQLAKIPRVSDQLRKCGRCPIVDHYYDMCRRRPYVWLPHILGHCRPLGSQLDRHRSYFAPGLSAHDILALCLFVFTDVNTRMSPFSDHASIGRLGRRRIVTEMSSGVFPCCIGWNTRGEPTKRLFMRVDMANYEILQAWPL